LITVVAVGVMAVIFAYLARIKKLRFCLKISFFIIFLFLALRYNYGSDYNNYLDMFLEINQLNMGFESIKDIWMNSMLFNIFLPGNNEMQMGVLAIEPGWFILCLLFRPLGFFAMIAFLALFNCIVYYYFIKKYVPSAYYWLAVFLYVFTPSMMLIQSSAMRQSVAISIFLLSINYIYKKDFLRYALLIFLATLFHFSAIILLPVYLLSMLRFKTNTPIAIGVFLLFLTLFLLQGLLSQIVSFFIGSFFPKYEIYQEAGTLGSRLGIAFNALIMFLILIFDRYQNDEVSSRFKIAILGKFITPFTFIMMMGRLYFYFDPNLFAVYPYILIKADKVLPEYPFLFKYVFVLALISSTLFLFWDFFNPDTWTASFITYNTIFSSPTIY